MANRLTRKTPSDKIGLDEEVQARFEKRYRRARNSLFPAMVTVTTALGAVVSNVFAAAIGDDFLKTNRLVVVGSALLIVAAASVVYYGTTRRPSVQAKYETVSQINDEHLKQLITGVAQGQVELDAIVTRGTERTLHVPEPRGSLEGP
jgi:hypothetical protein